MIKSIAFLALCAAVTAVGLLSGGGDAAAMPPHVEAWMLEPGTGLSIVGAGLIVNAGTLRNLYVGFKKHFQNGLTTVPAMYEDVATVVPSTTGEEDYGWLGEIPGMREWVGERHIHALSAHGYTIVNKDFELTVGVDRNRIEDDRLGIYKPMFENMGNSIARHPNELVFGLLKTAFTSRCYDGQYMIDTDHPVIDESGETVSVSNFGGGAGAPWFLMDLSRPLKPIIFQERKKPDFVALDNATDENVFMRRQYLYGAHSRSNVGFGFWQTLYGSRATLDVTSYGAAYSAMQSFKADHGAPLAITPTHLVVPPALQTAARKVLKAERLDNGESNVWHGTTELIVCPWLA